MKRLLIFFILTLSVQLSGKCQPQTLPDEIQQYYKTKNFISLYSEKSERDLIDCLYLRGEDLPSIQDPRLNRMVHLLFSTWIKYYYPATFVGDKKGNIPPELLLPTFNKVKNWEKDKDHIFITTYTYVLPGDMIHKAVNSYKLDLTPDNMAQPDLSEDHIIRYQEIHDWTLENGKWVKFPVMKVLIN